MKKVSNKDESKSSDKNDGRRENEKKTKQKKDGAGNARADRFVSGAGAAGGVATPATPVRCSVVSSLWSAPLVDPVAGRRVTIDNI